MKKNPWTKVNWFYYQCMVECYYKHHSIFVTRTLDVVSYHLIKWFHGEGRLIEMSKMKPSGIDGEPLKIVPTIIRVVKK